MLRKISGAWLLIILSFATARAQSRDSSTSYLAPASVAITYNVERAKVSPSHCGCFWFQGVSADADWNVWNHLGIAAEVGGAHASNIAPGIDISKINFLLGPRYTWRPSPMGLSTRGASLFGEVLLGGVHAFDTIIPTNSGTESGATAFAMQTGAGANLRLMPHLSLRLIELDYTYSQLQNGGNSTQSGFRVATGMVWHLR